MSKKVKLRLLETILIAMGGIIGAITGLLIEGLIFAYGIATSDIINIILGSLLSISLIVLWCILIDYIMNKMVNLTN